MLDPHVQGLIDFCTKNQVPYFNELPPEAARAAYVAGKEFTQLEPEPVGVVQEHWVSGLPGEPEVKIRIYKPSAHNSRLAELSEHGSGLAVTLWLHGGGWVIGNLETHDALCRQLVNRVGCAVVAVEYRLAPEHPFPAAVQDALGVLQWVLQQGGVHGLDPTRVAVAGDSAGGNLAAVLALAHRNWRRQAKGQLAALRSQLLVYPVTQLGEITPSAQRWDEGYLLSSADLAYFQQHYVGAGAVDPDWRHSPLKAGDHTELAPAIIITAGYDPLRDDGDRYAVCLSKAGNIVTQVCFERQIHGFLLMTRLVPEAATAVDWISASLRKALA